MIEERVHILYLNFKIIQLDIVTKFCTNNYINNVDINNATKYSRTNDNENIILSIVD